MNNRHLLRHAHLVTHRNSVDEPVVDWHRRHEYHHNVMHLFTSSLSRRYTPVSTCITRQCRSYSQGSTAQHRQSLSVHLKMSHPDVICWLQDCIHRPKIHSYSNQRWRGTDTFFGTLSFSLFDPKSILYQGSPRPSSTKFGTPSFSRFYFIVRNDISIYRPTGLSMSIHSVYPDSSPPTTLFTTMCYSKSRGMI